MFTFGISREARRRPDSDTADNVELSLGANVIAVAFRPAVHRVIVRGVIRHNPRPGFPFAEALAGLAPVELAVSGEVHRKHHAVVLAGGLVDDCCGEYVAPATGSG